jgi:prepilin-type N-terminal cleavage/methylation domain-containing protein
MFGRGQKGFTLIEVLVVLGIIGVLAAILLPVLARSKAKSARVKCCSNLSQMAKAFTSFAGDFDNRLPWQLTKADEQEQFGNQFMLQLGVIFSAPALKHEIVEAAILSSPCDAERKASLSKLEERWNSIDARNGKMISDREISYLLVDGADIGRPTTVLAAVRNLYPCNLKTARWVGADEDHDYAVTGLNKGQGQMVMADGSIALSTDADIGKNGKLVLAHMKSSGGVTTGNASTHLIGCVATDGSIAFPPSGKGCGLLATYYTGVFNGTKAERIDKTLHLPFGNSQIYGVPYDVPLKGSSPGNAHPLRSAKWGGQFLVPHSEPYTFYVSVDNEAWLYIDGNEVLHRSTGGYGGVIQYQKTSPISFQAGEWVDIELRILEHHPGSPTHVKVEWASPSTKRSKIACESMRPSGKE